MINQKLMSIGLGFGLILGSIAGNVYAASKWKVQCQQGSLEKVSTYEFRCVVTEAKKWDYRAGTCNHPLKLTAYDYAGLNYACVQQKGGQTTADKYKCRTGYSANPQAANQNQTCRKKIPASQTYQAPYLKPLN